MLTEQLAQALAARALVLAPDHSGAVRLFNGFYEGCPPLAVDLYARTLVLHNYSDPPAAAVAICATAAAFYRAQWPWLRAVLLKAHHSPDPAQRRGELVFGTTLDHNVRENGVRYAVDLQLNRDCSLYLDTRLLRAWAKAQLLGKTVLNTFAYTGSLGVAALAGGATRVVQLDRNRAFLNLAKDSYTLNGFAICKSDFLSADFWRATAQLRRANAQFDGVFLDPPFFATDHTGQVDLLNDVERLINKVRPLVADGGCLVVVNNALFLSGADFWRTLEAVGADGYLTPETIIPVPADFTGYASTHVTPPPVDPTPFNHPTKIAVLRVRRK